MILADTHTHLYSDDFSQDMDSAIRRAAEQGVSRFFLPAIDSQTTDRMLSLESRYPQMCHAMMGLHPTSVKPESWWEELECVRKWLDSRHFVAVGEIGMDLYWDDTTLEIQREAFSRQVDWALELDLPVAIHCRDAFDEVFEVLESKDRKKLRGIFHCFSGDRAEAQRALDLNMLLGISGIVTYKNNKLETFLREIPLEKIVLETDAPYLAPVPFRGKRNESAYLVHTARKVADVYGLPLEAVAEATTANALKIYGI